MIHAAYAIPDAALPSGASRPGERAARKSAENAPVQPPTDPHTTARSEIDVFVSYAREDQDFVRSLVGGLVRRGCEPWVDWDDIPGSARWRDEVKGAIEAANAFLFVISPDSVSSVQCAAEIAHAGELSKRVIPVVHRRVPAAELSPVVRAHHWLEPGKSESLDELCDRTTEAIKTDLDHVREHTRLLRRAIEWEKTRKDRSFLLRGRELNDAERWLRGVGAETQPAPAPLHAAYIVTSRAAATRSARSRLLATSVALVITAVLALAAWFAREEAVAQRQRAEREEAVAQEQRDIAKRERSVAQSRELASTSALQHASDPELALLLAIEAVKRAPTIEAERALRQGLQASSLETMLRGHEGQVWDVAYSADGRSIVSASADGTARIWRDGAEVLALRGHREGLYEAAFSPDGGLIATASVDGTARIWSASDGAELLMLPHRGEVRDLAFNRDGSLLASVDDEGNLSLWSTRSGRLLGTWGAHLGDGHGVAFDPTRTRVVTAGEDGVARIWDIDAPGPPVVLTGHEGAVLDAVFNPDGTLVATAGQDDTVRLWNASSGELDQILRGHDLSVQAVAFSPDGARLVSASVDETARVWEVSTGRQVLTLRGHHDVVQGADFAPDGWTVVTGGEDGTVRTWRGEPDGGRTLYGHDGGVQALSATEDHVITGAADGVIGIWDPLRAAPVRWLEGHSDAVIQLVTDKAKTRVASASIDGTARVWDIASGRSLAVLEAGEDGLSGVALSPDGTRAVTVGSDGAVRMWDVSRGTELQQLDTENVEPGDELAHHAYYAPDGAHVVTYLESTGSIRVWNGMTGRAITTLEEPEASSFFDLDFSPDGRYLAAAAEDDAVWVWDLGTGRVHLELRGHTDAVFTTAWSEDGTRIYSGSFDGTVRIWDATDGTAIATLRGHTGAITDLTPFGARLVSCSLDTTCRIWDAERGETLRTLHGYTGPVDSEASPDGTWLVSTSGSSARLDRCYACEGVADLLKVAERTVSRDFTAEERRLFLHEGE